MQAANLEAIVPGLAEARAGERLNRGLAFAGLTHTVCGVEVLPITPFHRIGLQLVQNPFAVRGEPNRAAVEQFLWFLSPSYPGPGKQARIQARCRRWLLSRRLRRLPERAAVAAVWAYLAEQLQDSGEFRANDGADHSRWVHWAAFDASFWLCEHGGFTLEEYLHTPCLILQQLYRAWRVNNPRLVRSPDGSVTAEEPTFINASDGLAGRWHRSQQEQIVASILAQRDRLP